MHGTGTQFIDGWGGHKGLETYSIDVNGGIGIDTTSIEGFGGLIGVENGV